MKFVQSMLIAVTFFAGTAVAGNQGEEWMTIEGQAATSIFEAMHQEELNGQKVAEGNVHLYCEQIEPNFPEGALGIFMPIAHCVAYPQVDWPAGVQGIVLPWFTLDGWVGNVMFESMPVEANERNEKIFEGNLRLVAEPELAVFELLADEETVTVYDQAATKIHTDLGIYDRTRDFRSVSGKGRVSCTLTTSELPPGALGIAAPSASCLGLPRVEFPHGAVGIVAPWFSLSGWQGYQLYRALPASEMGDNTRSISGELEITSDMRGFRPQVKIKKVD